MLVNTSRKVVMSRLVAAILFLNVYSLSMGFELPFLRSCTLEDSECHIRCVDKFFEMYAQGIPELDVPSMDPLQLGNISTKGSLAFHMVDVKLYKFPITKCQSVSLKGFTKDGSKSFRLMAKFKSPDIILHTHCKVMGKLLLFNVDGDTDIEANLKNVNVDVVVVLEPYKKDNKIYYRAESLTPQITFGNMKIAFKNSTFFGGDPVFSDAFADTVNDNWQLLADDIEPELNKGVAIITMDILSKILTTIPHDRFFKEE